MSDNRNITNADRLEIESDCDDDYPLTSEQLEELEARAKCMNENPAIGIPWEDVRRKLSMATD